MHPSPGIRNYQSPVVKLGKSDHMVDLNDKLLHFTTGSTKSDGLHAMGSAGGTSAVDKFVFFDPNDKGQGFATCLLDVSAFPESSNTGPFVKSAIDCSF
ncbi:hypothetical protein RND71_019570 [Anisodus tanguticus]|uniref:Integrator complex subunit 7-like C-terminal domain-containing protein n=1 Tax=Anisodus tanguticus TaxID=243964 RepID=A0AAE1S0S7_9SOLA|nr:hypothetical protein RND71_019570 [Anisodus tanguticus]